MAAGTIVDTDIPARLDRLPWGVAAERKPLEAVARPLTFIDID
jgi:hypothetical protein